MPNTPKEFKRPPKRYQPKGLAILYEDRDLLVVDKVSGLLTMRSDKVRENSATYLLNDYVRKGNPKARHRVFVVHRLDKDTSGVLVFAKSEGAKRFLQDEWQGFKKTYYAVVHGHLAKKEGVLESYLAENSAHNMYIVTDPKKGKLAKTGYRVLKENADYSLLEIDLLTGRKNQVRVQFAEEGCPVVGDKKYGRKEKGIKRLALHAGRLELLHPHSKEPMTFTAKTPTYFPFLMKGSQKDGRDPRTK